MLDFCTADDLMGLVDGCVDCDRGGVQLRYNGRASRNNDAKPRLAEIHRRRTPTYLSMQFLRSRLSCAAFSPGPLCEKRVDGEGQSRQGRASSHEPHRTDHSLTHHLALCYAPIVDSPTLRSIVLPIGYPGTSPCLRLPQQFLAATSTPLRQYQPNRTHKSRGANCFCILMEVSAF